MSVLVRDSRERTGYKVNEETFLTSLLLPVLKHQLHLTSLSFTPLIAIVNDRHLTSLHFLAFI